MGKYRSARRFRRQPDGLFHIAGKTYKNLIGRRQQVGGGTAYKTAGGLIKSDLHFNGRRWVSLDKFKSSTQRNRLAEHGYGAQKGGFGYVRIKPSGKPRTRKQCTQIAARVEKHINKPSSAAEKKTFLAKCAQR